MAQAKIIKKIADIGSCVIVGRTADYVLKDHENVIRIFIHAPKQYRMKRVMEVYGDTPKGISTAPTRQERHITSTYPAGGGQTGGITICQSIPQ